MNEPADWFPTLEPPPDGLGRLRARLDAPRPGRRWVALAVVAAAAALAAILWPRPRVELAEDPALLAWVDPPSEAVTLPEDARASTVLQRVPGEVVWYRVESTARVPLRDDATQPSR